MSYTKFCFSNDNRSSWKKAVNGLLTCRVDLERVLVDLGAVKLNDQRLQKKNDPAEESTSKIRQGKTTGDDDDSDWD